MSEANKANRRVCDVDIYNRKTMTPFLNFRTANTTTTGLSGDTVFAKAKGSRKIAYFDSFQGTLSIEAQVYPLKFFALLSDGTIESTAAYASKKTVTCLTDGELELSDYFQYKLVTKLNEDLVEETSKVIIAVDGEVKMNTIFVYPEGSYGDEDSAIKGVYEDGVFTAINTEDIVSGETYEIGYVVARSMGVKRITFNNKRLPKDYYIRMKTVEKDEDGFYVPFIMTAYKAAIQRSIELSFSSEGDPASITLTFDLLEDSDGNIFDMVELTDDADDEVEYF